MWIDEGTHWQDLWVSQTRFLLPQNPSDNGCNTRRKVIPQACSRTISDHRQVLGGQTVQRSTCSCTTDTEKSSAHTYTKQVRKSEDLEATTCLFFSPRTLALGSLNKQFGQ
jgi:hypothetical protein